MSGYMQLSEELTRRIEEDHRNHVSNPYAFKNEDVVRRYEGHDGGTLLRPAFVRDCEKIMNLPGYNRYADKTQVFSLYKNDDITRRMVHVQLVSRTARNIGRVLGLNTDLIESISLGHDLGHTPFGHEGERILNKIYHERTNRFFNHNIQSARVLDRIFPVNISLQTLDGIICHNGEVEQKEYRPQFYHDFSEFDLRMKKSLEQENYIKELVPQTLEGCVMRLCDIIAYVGKDRQDAVKLGIIKDNSTFPDNRLGNSNAQIIHNLTVNIIENSYAKPYISMDEGIFAEFSKLKQENYELIYRNPNIKKLFSEQIQPMFEMLYEKLYDDLVHCRKNSVIFNHHLEYVKSNNYHQERVCYEKSDPDDIVTDYIAGMTDDYFIDLFDYLFPKEKFHVRYNGYFD